jgi:hypothetical protein
MVGRMHACMGFSLGRDFLTLPTALPLPHSQDLFYLPLKPGRPPSPSPQPHAHTP